MECGAEDRKRVVIVGGGIAGALIAKILQKVADVYLIDPKEYFEIPWANLRSKVEPAVAEKSLINHYEYLTHGTLIISTAVNVTEKEVLTSDGRVLAYDYLVIATGHTYSTPITRKDRLEYFQKENQKILSSDSIIIIGGGPTGVELAGEIAVDHPEKRVTLVHNGPRLLEFIGPKAGNKALEWLRSKKVEVLLDQAVDLKNISEADKMYQISTGENIAADCHFLCIGRPLGSSWLKGSFLMDYLDRNGRMMVDENLRVGGVKNIFAIGDITDVPELKQGYTAQRQAVLAGKNLKLLVKGAKDSKLLKYRSTMTMAMVTLGRNSGVAEFPLGTIGGFLPGMIKSRDLFVGRTRKLMGLEN